MNEIGDALATLSTGLKTLAEGIKVISKQVNQMELEKKVSSPTNSTRRVSIKSSSKNQGSKKTQSKKNLVSLNNTELPKTASDTVYELIKNSNNGVNYAKVVENTGYNKKKIANIFFNLKKQGKIKSVSKGVYTLA